MNGYMNYRACNLQAGKPWNDPHGENGAGCSPTVIAAIHVTGVNYVSAGSRKSMLHVLVSYQKQSKSSKDPGGGTIPTKLLEIDVSAGVTAANIAASMQTKSFSTSELSEAKKKYSTVESVASTYDSTSNKIHLFVRFDYGNTNPTNMMSSSKRVPLVVWQFSPKENFASFTKTTWWFKAGATASGGVRPPLPFRTVSLASVPGTKLIAATITTNHNSYCSGCAFSTSYLPWGETMNPDYKCKVGGSCAWQCWGARSGKKNPNAFSACSSIELWSVSGTSLTRYLGAWRKAELPYTLNDVHDDGRLWFKLRTGIKPWQTMGLGGELDGTFTLRQAGAINPSRQTNSLSPLVDTAVAHYPSSNRYYVLGAAINGLIQSVDITDAVTSSLNGASSSTPSGNTAVVNKVTENANSELAPVVSGTTLTSTAGQVIGSTQGTYPRIGVSNQKLYYLSQTQKVFVIDLSLEIPCDNLMEYLDTPLSNWIGGKQTATLNLRSELADTNSELVPWECTGIKKVENMTLSDGKIAGLTKDSVCCKPANGNNVDVQVFVTAIVTVIASTIVPVTQYIDTDLILSAPHLRSL